MARAFALGFLLISLFGCATTDLSPQPTQVLREKGTEPLAGIPSTANVGQNIFEQFNYIATKNADHYVVEKAIKASVGPGMNVDITPSTTLYKANDQKYCVDNYGNDCLYDVDGDGAFERASSKPGMIEFKKDLPEPIKYESAIGNTVTMDAGGYKYQLIYQGRDGSTLRVRYMEFTDNLARAAFTQDLTYPISRDNKSEIVFRNVKIDVSKVSDSSIEYTVISDAF